MTSAQQVAAAQWLLATFRGEEVSDASDGAEFAGLFATEVGAACAKYYRSAPTTGVIAAATMAYNERPESSSGPPLTGPATIDEVGPLVDLAFLLSGRVATAVATGGSRCARTSSVVSTPARTGNVHCARKVRRDRETDPGRVSCSVPRSLGLGASHGGLLGRLRTAS